ncbi:MAG: hypothetical protein R3E32_03855 [Chitinophagales bacterium]
MKPRQENCEDCQEVYLPDKSNPTYFNGVEVCPHCLSKRQEAQVCEIEQQAAEHSLQVCIDANLIERAVELGHLLEVADIVRFVADCQRLYATKVLLTNTETTHAPIFHRIAHNFCLKVEQLRVYEALWNTRRRYILSYANSRHYMAADLSELIPLLMAHLYAVSLERQSPVRLRDFVSYLSDSHRLLYEKVGATHTPTSTNERSQLQQIADLFGAVVQFCRWKRIDVAQFITNP